MSPDTIAATRLPRTIRQPARRSRCCRTAPARRSAAIRGSIRTKCAMDAAAKALRARQPRHLAARRRAARSGSRCSTRIPCSPRACSTAMPPGRSAGAFSPAGSSARCAARAAVRCALLSPRPCRSRRAARPRRRPLRGGPRRAVECRRHGPARAGWSSTRSASC